MNKIKMFLICVALVSCSVKKTETPPSPSNSRPNQPVENSTEGFLQSVNKKFYIKWSPKELQSRRDNTVTYSILNAHAKSLETAEADIAIRYDMPSMPDMGGPWSPRSWNRGSAGTLNAVYRIVHGGDWRFSLIFSKDGSEIDRFEYDVKEVY